MWHEISPSTVPNGPGALAGNYARANCARGALAADTFVHFPASYVAFGASPFATGAGHLSANIAPRSSLDAEQWEARRNYNENAHANRRAPPGGNPRCRRKREHD